MYVIKNNKNAETNRLGISVSKKVGKSVVRSRVTRLIKESYRLTENEIKSGYDIVVIARVNAKDATYAEINASLESYYAIGDEGKAYITDIKPREWFLKLSIRKYLVEQERKSYEKYLEPAEEVTVTLGEKYKDLLK